MFKFKNIKRTLTNSKIIHYLITRIVSILIYGYLFFVEKTSKVIIETPKEYKDFTNKKYIFCFWHGRLVSPLIARKYCSKSSVLLSKGKDADIICLLMKLCGVGVIRGSTDIGQNDKGGTTSLKLMVDLLRRNASSIAIASDGPVGPRMRVGVGTAVLALLSKTEVVPITMSAKRVIIAKSWDKNFILLPFSRIKIKFGLPIAPYLEQQTKKPVEYLRLEIENVLNIMTNDLDKEMKHLPILPADLDRRGNPVKRKINDNE
ncbi:lysophospholipid acyltransferase family protein [Rickettsiales bacterium LUAb2]